MYICTHKPTCSLWGARFLTKTNKPYTICEYSIYSASTCCVLIYFWIVAIHIQNVLVLICVWIYTSTPASSLRSVWVQVYIPNFGQYPLFMSKDLPAARKTHPWGPIEFEDTSRLVNWYAFLTMVHNFSIPASPRAFPPKSSVVRFAPAKLIGFIKNAPSKTRFVGLHNA